jgi:CHAD domain-containing protein
VQAVELRASEVFEHAGDALDIDQIENVHDMRVATRRLRAAMEVFEPCFPRKRYRKALKRVKRLADALGERRDRDVQIEMVEGFFAELPESDHDALRGLLSELRREQAAANEALAPAVADRRLEKLRARLGRLVEADGVEVRG